MIVFFFKSMQWQNSPKLVTVLVRKRKTELHQFDLICNWFKFKYLWVYVRKMPCYVFLKIEFHDRCCSMCLHRHIWCRGFNVSFVVSDVINNSAQVTNISPTTLYRCGNCGLAIYSTQVVLYKLLVPTSIVKLSVDVGIEQLYQRFYYLKRNFLGFWRSL